MLQIAYLSIIIFIAAFIGSLNGLGVSFLLSVVLLAFGPHEHSSILWILYFSSLIVALIFVLSRPRLRFENFYAFISLSFFSGLGLLIGKIIISHHNYYLLKIIFGLLLIVFSFVLNKLKSFRDDNEEVYRSEVFFNFSDLLIFFAIGFCAGLFDFGIAAFVYVQMFLKNKFYDIEKIDICVYGVLIFTSIINLLITIFRYEQIFPEYIGLSSLLFILLGAALARLVYKFISHNVRKKIVLFGIFLIGMKIFIFNLNLISVNTLIVDFNTFINTFLRTL